MSDKDEPNGGRGWGGAVIEQPPQTKTLPAGRFEDGPTGLLLNNDHYSFKHFA